jgi:hypothetical protein
MALIQSYEVPGTGLTAANAYFVVTDVKVQKRMEDIPTPVDTSDPTGFTNGGVHDENIDPVHYRAGYVAECCVTIWATKEARESSNKPIGMAGAHTTEVEAELHIGTAGLDHRCVFFIDMDSGDSHIVQAYSHLKSLDYFENAIED